MKLLKELYLHDAKSHSQAQQEFKGFVKKLCVKRGANVKGDRFGNLYVTKGESETYPCICAHLDEVHDYRGKNFKIFDMNGFIWGYSLSRHETHGIGADDKNGIWIALKILEEFPAVKLAFFADEESGCIGSDKADMSFFDDCRFVVQCDRKGNSDFVNSISYTKLLSDDFLKALKIEKYGYKTVDGGLTDVKTLKRNGLKVSCCNMSCGYYNPHTDDEYTDKKDLLKCLKFVRHIVRDLTDVYHHEYEQPKYENSFGFGDDLWWGYGRSRVKVTSDKKQEAKPVEEKPVFTRGNFDEEVEFEDRSDIELEADFSADNINDFPIYYADALDLAADGCCVEEIQQELCYYYGRWFSKESIQELICKTNASKPDAV